MTTAHIMADAIQSWSQFSHELAQGFEMFCAGSKEILASGISHWPWILGFAIYWIISAFIWDKYEAYLPLYPFLFPREVWILAPIISFVAPFYLYVYGVHWIMDKDFRRKPQWEKGKYSYDPMLQGAVMIAMVAAYGIMSVLTYQDISLNEPEKTKLVSTDGLVCYAYMNGRHQDVISHSHCKRPERELAGK